MRGGGLSLTRSRSCTILLLKNRFLKLLLIRSGHIVKPCPMNAGCCWIRYHLEDIANKVVGVGSVGTWCGVALFVAEENDPLFLQIKEARPSVLEPYAGKSEFRHEGERIVVGQRLMQSASDMMLGWTTGTGKYKRHFYIRQLRDMKFSVDISIMKPWQLAGYAEVCGWTLARAHARSGDAPMIYGYIGKSDIFDRAIGTFAELYAEQTERDCESVP